MRKLVVIVMLFALGATPETYAQKKAAISFATTEHDFGTFKEEAGNQTFRYEFTNKGNDTLKIQTVKAACGCTQTDWSRNAILPGGKGYVTVTYDPRNRPGPFSKGVDVISNDPVQTRVTLVVKGTVTARQRTIEDDYPQKIGNLRFGGNAQVVFQNIPNTASQTDTMKLYNEWKQPMTFGFTKLPTYITVKAVPEKLKPGQKGYLLITYDAAKRNDFGFVYDRFTFETNDSLQPEKMVSVSANIVEDFASWTPEQMAKAPKISFATNSYDFGTVTEGSPVEYDYVFTNLGENDLYIRKVKGG
jgi:hypothetical protein